MNDIGRSNFDKHLHCNRHLADNNPQGFLEKKENEARKVDGEWVLK